MRISVANFSNTKLPGKRLSIANSMPKGVRMHSVKALFPTLAAFIVPPWPLVSGYKAGTVSWTLYARTYGARLQKINLEQVMRKLCDLAGSDDLVLCSWEGADVEECHRKLLFDALPAEIRGERQ